MPISIARQACRLSGAASHSAYRRMDHMGGDNADEGGRNRSRGITRRTTKFRGRGGEDRALVLGGGGPVGIAWETGVAAGLAAEGVKLADADFILGTSAGSFVGAQLSGGRDPKALAAQQIELGRNPPPVRPARRPPRPT